MSLLNEGKSWKFNDNVNQGHLYLKYDDCAGLDIGYVPAGPDAFFRWSGQFGPQQLIFYWPAGPVDLLLLFFIFYFFLFLFFITIHILKMLRGWLLNNLIIGLC